MYIAIAKPRLIAYDCHVINIDLRSNTTPERNRIYFSGKYLSIFHRVKIFNTKCTDTQHIYISTVTNTMGFFFFVKCK